MRNLLRWAKAHPITAVVFAVSTQAVAAATGFGYLSLKLGIVIFGFLILLFASVIAEQLPKVIALVLILAFAVPTPVKAEDGGQGGSGPLGGCVTVVAGVVVLIVSGYITYSLSKFCEKHFPKPPAPPKKQFTNDPPDTVQGGFGGSSDYDAAAFNISEHGSCPPECLRGSGGSGDQPVPTTFEFTLHVNHGDPGVADVTASAARISQSTNDVLTWDQYVASARELGVTVTANSGPPSFSHNGYPVQASFLKWDAQRQVIKVEQGSSVYYTVIVERSSDFKTWVPVLKTEVIAESTLRVRDTCSDSQQFYRFYGALSD